MNNVTLYTSTIDDVFVMGFIKNKQRHYLFKRFPDAMADEMMTNVLSVMVPIIDRYDFDNQKPVQTTFSMNEHCAREVWESLVEDGFSDTSFENYKKPQRTFKIRSKKTGQYSKGGSGGWSKKGKVWSCIGHLKSHFSQNQRQDYKDCEVIVLKEEKRFDLEDLDKYSE